MFGPTVSWSYFFRHPVILFFFFTFFQMIFSIVFPVVQLCSDEKLGGFLLETQTLDEHFSVFNKLKVQLVKFCEMSSGVKCF